MSIVSNHRTMAKRAVVAAYASKGELSPPEEAMLYAIRDEVKEQPILDLGVGAGRTVSALRSLSQDYLGIDYAREMVTACRHRFPGVRIEQGDARDLSAFPSDTFRLVVFSCNGLGMLGHADRLCVLSEVYRVLDRRGAFMFSTHNRRSREHDLGFQLPPFEPTMHPLRLVARTVRFGIRTVARVRNRVLHKPCEVRTDEYSIINDVCHDYGTLLYYTDLPTQRLQLEQAGFRPGAVAYDLAGKQIDGDTRDNSIGLLARK
jgi:SAM-dependent methyltransferase